MSKNKKPAILIIGANKTDAMAQKLVNLLNSLEVVEVMENVPSEFTFMSFPMESLPYLELKNNSKDIIPSKIQKKFFGPKNQRFKKIIGGKGQR